MEDKEIMEFTQAVVERTVKQQSQLIGYKFETVHRRLSEITDKIDKQNGKVSKTCDRVATLEGYRATRVIDCPVAPDIVKLKARQNTIETQTIAKGLVKRYFRNSVIIICLTIGAVTAVIALFT